jgi:uncharacterized protein (DUF58 family)
VPLLPSSRLVLLVLLAAGTFLLGTPVALAIDAILLVFVVIEGVTLYRGLLPSVNRSVPARIPLEGKGIVQIEFSNPSDRPLSIAWRMDVDAGLGAGEARGGEVVLPARGRAMQELVLFGVERGRRSVGDVHVRVLGPFELLWRPAMIAGTDEVVVQPGLLQLRQRRRLAVDSRLGAGSRRVRRLGEGREFERLREYARGDDPRRIDWKATAKRSETIVREFEAERSQSVVVAIDAGRMMAERFAGRERLDHSLAAALLLADAASTQGDAVGLLVFADTVQSFIPPTRAPLARVAEALANVRAVRLEPDYPAAFTYLDRRLRRRSLIVLFSDVIDAHTSDALLAHLGGSARRHLPLLVAMRNIELEAASQSPVADEAAAFRRAAAEEMLQARAAALAATRRQGVVVADVRPNEAVEESIGHYLAVKRRGLL